MKFSPMHALLILAMACPAFAQDTPPPASSPPQQNPADTMETPPQSTTPPPATDPMTNQTPTQAAARDPHNIQSSGPEDWAMVNGHERGYLTKDDAMPNSWLAQNFSSCDKDQDGKISQAEYDSCVKRR